MKTHRLIIIILPLLLALGLVTVALAAAQKSVSAPPQSALGAPQSVPVSVPGSNAGTTGVPAQQALGQSQPQAAEKPAILSNSAMMPGFLQANDTRPFFVPQAPRAQVDAQGILSLPGGPISGRMGASSPQALQPGFTVDMAYNAVEGLVNPGDQVTVSVGTAYGAAVADATGFFWTPVWQTSGSPLDLTGGETIEVYVNGALADTIVPAVISGGMDVLADSASGTLNGLGAGIPVTVTIGGWGALPAAGALSEATVTGAGGDFSVTFDGIDLTAGYMAQVDYSAGPYSTVRGYVRSTPSSFVIENFTYVAGYADPGQDVQVTVYASYPNDIRWQGGGKPNSPLGFYIITGVDSQVGDYVEVVLGGSVFMNTTVANLRQITFDAASDQVSGTAPDGEDVLVNSFGWAGDQQTYMETSATAGVGDTFNATLPADLHARDAVAVYVTDDQGNSTAIYGGAPYIEALIDPASDFDCVAGRVEAPNQPITLSIHTATGEYTRTNLTDPSGPGNELLPGGGCYLVWGSGWGPINFAPGDVITLQSPNWSGSLTVAGVSVQPDPAGDQITGSAPDGEVRVDVSRLYGEQYPAGEGAARVATASGGGFTADFSAFDLRDGDNVYLRHFDPVSGFATQLAGGGLGGTPVNYFIVYAPWGVYGRVSTPGESVTASLYDGSGNWLASSSGNATPWEYWLGSFQSNLFAPGYWITVTGSSGWSAGFQIPVLTIYADDTTDRIWGEAPKDRLIMETDWGFNGFLPSDGFVLDTSAFGHDLKWGNSSNIAYVAPSGDRFNQTKRWPYVVAQYGPETSANRVWGNSAASFANLPVTVTLPGGTVIGTAVAPANVYGDFDTSDLPVGSITPGNLVYVDFNGDVESLEVLPITAEANPDTNVVTVTAPVGTPIYMNADGPNKWWDSKKSYPNAVIGPEGYFVFDLSVDGYDIVPGTRFNVHTSQYHGHNTQYSFWLPALNINVNYGHDWVEGNFDSGHTMWLTVTNSTGAIKATATGVTSEIPWWNGQAGFSTNYNIFWQGAQPDMQPGDWVYASMDNGLTAEARLGTIEAVVDVAADTVIGTISAPWYTATLNGNCGIWEPNAPGMGFQFDPNGGSFTCDFSGQWDIIAGNMIGVSYNEPDGDQVINVAPNPAPYLRIQTWADGQPAEGSNFSLYVQYRNEGDGPTENAIISATLESGLTYLGDTSDLPRSGSGVPGDPLIWQLGTLLPDRNKDERFYLFVQVTAAAGDWVTNTVQIENGVPYSQKEPKDKISQWYGQVVDNNTDLNIGKGAWTWDPVPGSQFVYNVNVCNNGSTDSAEVTVTDTLPLSTTLVSWWGQQPGWVEVSRSAHELVVSRLTFPGNRCGEVYLRVELDADAWAGMELHNTAFVYTSNDLDPNNNQADLWHNVGSPHANLRINKQWNWGELVPGGEIRYNIDYRNDGNLPADGVSITETLPASTTFRAAYWYDETGGHPVTPTLVTDQIVVWEIGGLDNGYGLNFEVILDIAPQAQPGLELVNTADITRLPNEDSYEDNTSSWTEMLYDHGPNLRVRKTGDWQGWGDGHYAWYNIIMENVGDMPAYTVTLTDTLPVSMTLDNLKTDWSQVIEYVPPDAEGRFRFTFRYLHPNWRREIWMSVYNPSPEPVIPGGQFFTNTVEIMPYAGEPTYADNTSEYTLTSGPDLYVKKSLVAGDILPGGVVTFSLVFGNDQAKQAWWWSLQGNAWMTDTLPAGTEFITATLRWCKDTPWCPVQPEIQGDTLVWQLYPIGTGQSNEVYLTVRLPDSLTGLDTVVNTAQIFSDQPNLDIEPYYDNNTSVYQAPVLLPYFEVSKVYDSIAVAGMPVAYTLTVSNIGNEAGTTVEVWDWLPDWVDYGGGGSYNAGLITWTLPEIGPGSDATAWFTGTLSCSAGGIVNNQYYFVNSSDQGITSTYGTPVSFTIQTPVMEVMAEASSTSVLTGEMVYFTGTATTNGTALTYAWDFGGDGSASGPDANHVFNTAGSYEVTLTVTDGCGYTAEYSLTVEVAAATRNVYLPIIRK